TFQRAYDRLSDDVHLGHATLIDPYAATNPGEYFAVVSELHFSDPRRLMQAEPDVGALLHAYYVPPPSPYPRRRNGYTSRAHARTGNAPMPAARIGTAE